MARLAASRLDGTIRGDRRSLPFRTSSLGGLLAFYSVIHVPPPTHRIPFQQRVPVDPDALTTHGGAIEGWTIRSETGRARSSYGVLVSMLSW